MATKPKVAFIGLGAMGMGMALHLLEDGFRVSGFDINPMALETLASKGGFAASSPQESARDASYIVCMVANAEQIKNVFFTESTGAVFGIPHDAIVIICSTVAPAFPQEVLRLFKEDFQRPDIRVVDCPVSGGTVRAAQGTLTILSSGSSATLKNARLILESMSESLYEIKGGLGAANKVKLINQQLAGIHIAISAEAMGLAATLGLNTKHLYESVLGTSAHSWMFENRVPHMLADDWTPHSALGIFVKDMGIVTSEGLNQKFPLFLASAAEQLYLLGAQMGYEREDDSGVVRVFLPRSPSLVSDSKSTQMDVRKLAGAYKLIHQLLEIVHTAAAIEAVALGINLGLPASELVSIISNAAGGSESFKVVAPKIVIGDFASGFTIAQTRDTLEEIIVLAKTYKYPHHLISSTHHLYELAIVQGLAAEGEAALFKIWFPSSGWTSQSKTSEPTRYKPLSLSQALTTLPKFACSTNNLLGRIQDRVQSEPDLVLVVLDDDPTGTQTCHDINVLTMWDVDILTTEFRTGSRGFFVLTNSRALSSHEARELVSEILRNVSTAASSTGKKFEVVLRGDSTLRGHFLEEIESHIDTIGSPDAWIITPFFEQGGRVTIEDVHYVIDKDTLVPVANTPFAADKTFGFKSSNLAEYVREKAGGRFSGKDIVSVTLEDIRQGGVTEVAKKLLAVPKGGVAILNAVQEEDMHLFCLGLLEVQKNYNRRFGYRSGASLVSSRLGIPRKEIILPEQLPAFETASRPGGLIVAGSYVPKSTEQLQSLIKRRGEKLTVITVEVPALLTESRSYSDTLTLLENSITIRAIIEKVSATLKIGKDVLVMTSRDLVTTDTVEPSSSPTPNGVTNLDINNLVANSLVHIIRNLNIRPRYLLAKGGVTSSDAATAGMAIKRARVLGQAALGVPIWWCEKEEDSKSISEGGREVNWTKLPLIVFPGNVGNEDTLAQVVERWAI